MVLPCTEITFLQLCIELLLSTKYFILVSVFQNSFINLYGFSYYLNVVRFLKRKIADSWSLKKLT